jgi:hypothetical protein
MMVWLQKGSTPRYIIDLLGRFLLRGFVVIAGIAIVLYLALGVAYFAMPGLLVSCPLTFRTEFHADNRGPVEFFVDWATWPRFVAREMAEARKQGVSSYNYWRASRCDDPQRRREIERAPN